MNEMLLIQFFVNSIQWPDPHAPRVFSSQSMPLRTKMGMTSRRRHSFKDASSFFYALAFNLPVFNHYLGQKAWYSFRIIKFCLLRSPLCFRFGFKSQESINPSEKKRNSSYPCVRNVGTCWLGDSVFHTRSLSIFIIYTPKSSERPFLHFGRFFIFIFKCCPPSFSYFWPSLTSESQVASDFRFFKKQKRPDYSEHL